jgi:hypothetical protein
MRKALLVVLTTVSLVLGFGAMANAAPKPAYKVTLTTSTTSSVAGRFITVAGKVTGPKATHKTVTIQRWYAGGPWINVAVATVMRNGKFSARVETPVGGNTSFRALKARSSARKAGVSPTRTTKVFQWLYLSNEPGFNGSTLSLESTIAGKVYSHALVVEDDGGGFQYKTNGLCTTFSTVAAYTKFAPASPTASMNLNVYNEPATGDPTGKTVAVSTAAPTTVTLSLVGGKYVSANVTDSTGDYQPIFGDPKVYCNASALPELTNSEIP